MPKQYNSRKDHLHVTALDEIAVPLGVVVPNAQHRDSKVGHVPVTVRVALLGVRRNCVPHLIGTGRDQNHTARLGTQCTLSSRT